MEVDRPDAGNGAAGTTFNAMTDAQLEKLNDRLAKIHLDKFKKPTEEQSYDDFKDADRTVVYRNNLGDKLAANKLSKGESSALYWFLRGQVGGDSMIELKRATEGDFLGALKELDKRWDPKRLVNKWSRIRNLVAGSVCSDLENLDSWLAEKENHKNKLLGQQITIEDLLVLGVMEGVPKELRGTADIAETRQNLDFATLKTMLSDKKDKLVGQQDADGRAKAHYTKAERSSGKCLWCGGSGHYAQKCRLRIEAEKGADKTKTTGTETNKGTKNKSKLKCFHCKEKGHTKNECPKLKATARLAETDS
jgi:hypothetical protein